MSKYQEELNKIIQEYNKLFNIVYTLDKHAECEYLAVIQKDLLQELIDERQQRINALKEIDELLKRLTLEQKKPLGATVYSIQAIIIETLEKGEDYE